MLDTTIKWLCWLGGGLSVLLGMSVVIAGTVDARVGVTCAGLAVMLSSSSLFSTANFFKVRRLKASLVAENPDSFPRA